MMYYVYGTYHFLDSKIFNEHDMKQQKLKYPHLVIRGNQDFTGKFTFNYIGPFSTILSAKEFIYKRRILYFDNNIFELEDKFNNSEFIEMYVQNMGYNKTKEILKRLYKNNPELLL